MGCSGLLILSLAISVVHCLETPDLGDNLDVDIVQNITGVLGEEVYLRCCYLGRSLIHNALWKRQKDSRMKTMRLTGFKGDKSFSHDSDFSFPASPTNLTVKMRVSSVETEGVYTCVFESDEEEITHNMFVTVLARPITNIVVNEEIVNGTHYQSVLCSAASGRPPAQISWLVNGSPPHDDFFTVEVSNTSHPNGTTTVSNVLRFPTHLLDEDRVICEVQHPTLPNRILKAAAVVTFVAPNVTMEAELVKEGEEEFWEVTCRASGGRPETSISLFLDTDGEDHGWKQRNSLDMQENSHRFIAHLYEGYNISCGFNHPKFMHAELRTITLPTFNLSAIKLLDVGFTTTNNMQKTKSLELEERESNTSIGLEVVGTVPRYTITCTKDYQPLPEGVKVERSILIVQGPLGPQHVGLYECEASYHGHSAMIQFNISIKPQSIKPVPPRLNLGLQKRGADRLVECSAADAVPAANVSWLLPEGVSGVSWFNLTSHNESHSVRGVLVVPACLPQEHTLLCVIDHPALRNPENRSITLPQCAPMNITVRSSSEWSEGERYTVLQCRVDSVGSAANMSWQFGNDDGGTVSAYYDEAHDWQSHGQVSGLVTAESTVRFPSAVYAGQNATCVVEHQSVNRPVRREIRVPLLEAPVLNVSLVRQQGSPLWLAVCEYTEKDANVNLTWVLPKNTTGQTSLHSGLPIKLTYHFSLNHHEGQALTCVVRYRHKILEKRTIHIPHYYISVKVANQTTPLHSRYGDDFIINRLALHEELSSQRILLKVNGNVPTYNLTCQRTDGSSVQMEGTALVFHSEVTEREAGLYTCHASFFHHKATVLIQVDVTCEDTQLLILVLICFCSALAVTFFLTVTLCVLCKENKGCQTEKRESISALTSLMQQPCSPELGKPAVPVGDNQEYAQLLSYSIVIDVKSTV